MLFELWRVEGSEQKHDVSELAAFSQRVKQFQNCSTMFFSSPRLTGQAVLCCVLCLICSAGQCSRRRRMCISGSSDSSSSGERFFHPNFNLHSNTEGIQKVRAELFSHAFARNLARRNNPVHMIPPKWANTTPREGEPWRFGGLALGVRVGYYWKGKYPIDASSFLLLWMLVVADAARQKSSYSRMTNFLLLCPVVVYNGHCETGACENYRLYWGWKCAAKVCRLHERFVYIGRKGNRGSKGKVVINIDLVVSLNLFCFMWRLMELNRVSWSLQPQLLSFKTNSSLLLFSFLVLRCHWKIICLLYFGNILRNFRRFRWVSRRYMDRSATLRSERL